MARTLVLCDGARPRIEASAFDETIALAHRGRHANVNLNIESPATKLFERIPGRALDLIMIAAYAYAADQEISRGGEADVYGAAWRREITLALPVFDQKFWSQAAVVEALTEALEFASGDVWQFRFTRARPPIKQFGLEIKTEEVMGKPDCLFMFSGGLDSLCAVVEAAAAGRRPILIGHSPAFHVGSRQRALSGLLHEHLPTWHFPYLSFATHRRLSTDPKDYSQRTRSFLYAALGAVIAAGLHIKSTALADNGVISLNLPINDQLLGSRASRSTHPKFLALFARLAGLVFPRGIAVVNPLWSRTRAETLEVLKTAGLCDLIEASRSCSHTRAYTSLQPHCGTCSQCIDRRFATARAGLEEYDPGERYRVDILRQELPAGDVRTMVLSYVRFAQTVSDMDGEEMFSRFPQLVDAIDPRSSDQRAVAETLTSMLRRHGQGVVSVLEEYIERHRRDLALSRLPPYGLLRVLQTPISSPTVGRNRPNSEFWHADDYRTVGYGDLTFNLPRIPASVVRYLHKAANDGKPDQSWAQLTLALQLTGRSMSAVFQNVSDWRVLIEMPSKGIYRLRLTAPARTTAA